MWIIWNDVYWSTHFINSDAIASCVRETGSFQESFIVWYYNHRNNLLFILSSLVWARASPVKAPANSPLFTFPLKWALGNCRTYIVRHFDFAHFVCVDYLDCRSEAIRTEDGKFSAERGKKKCTKGILN